MTTKKILPLLFIPLATFATAKEMQITITKPYYKNASLLVPTNQILFISKEQINAAGTNSLTEILNAKNNIQIQTYSPGRTVISMRGFGDNATSNSLILFNGQPFINPDCSTAPFDTIPTNEIERIEVATGSSGILYGDQAVGGIVNIITTAPEITSNTIGISAGNFATYKAQFNYGGISNYNNSYRVGATIYTTNNYREHNAEKTNNFSADLTHKNTYLRYRKINQHLEFPGKLSWQQVGQNPQQAENDIAYNKQDHDIIQLGFNYYFLPSWSVTTDLAYRTMSNNGAFAWNQQPKTFEEKRQIVSLRPKTSGTIKIKKIAVSPIIGADFDYGKHEFNASQNTQNQHAFYSQLIVPITSKISATLGARYSLASYNLATISNNQPVNKAFITSYDLSWQAQDNLAFFIRRAENYRFPKTDEMMATQDNKPLQTQIGVSYEAGLNYTNSGLAGALTIYQLDLKNEILCIPMATANYFVTNKNLDPTRRTGTTITLSTDITKHWQLSIDYNFINARFRSGDFVNKKIPFVANNNFRLAATFKPQNNLKFIIESIFAGARYPANDVENRAGKIGGTTIYNLGISYEKNHYTLTVRGNNITNKLYYGYVVTTYQNSLSSNWYYPATGFTFTTNLTFKL